MKKHTLTSQETPVGLNYLANVTTTAEQAAFIEQALRLPLKPVLGPGNRPAKRLKASFGFEYVSNGRPLITAPPIPVFLLQLLEKCLACCAAHDLLIEEEFNQCSVQMYPSGAGIGAHIDSFLYGKTILGMSFGGQATMRFRNKITDHQYEVSLSPCSLLVIQNVARFGWSHKIPGTSIKQVRWSVTWRHYAAGRQARETEPHSSKEAKIIP